MNEILISIGIFLLINPIIKKTGIKPKKNKWGFRIIFFN